MYLRLNRHNSDNDSLSVHNAIHKYGKRTEDDVEILEFIESKDRTLLQERERYWIKYYNTFLEEKGYNLTLGGDGASEGVLNPSARFTEETLAQLINELIENKVYIKDLAVKYKVSPEAISEINNGRHYYNENLSYPLRPDTRFTSEQLKQVTGVNKNISKFNQEEFNEIVDLLKNSNMTIKSIAEKFGCCTTVISHINNGKTYTEQGLEYPIRKKNLQQLK